MENGYGSGVGDGIEILGALSNTIGGTIAADRNIISGNDYRGVEIDSPAIANLVEGNYIGTDITGTVALGNGAANVYVAAAGNTIGGTVAGAGNVIAGGGSYGVKLTTSRGDRQPDRRQRDRHQRRRHRGTAQCRVRDLHHRRPGQYDRRHRGGRGQRRLREPERRHQHQRRQRQPGRGQQDWHQRRGHGPTGQHRQRNHHRQRWLQQHDRRHGGRCPQPHLGQQRRRRRNHWHGQHRQPGRGQLHRHQRRRNRCA